MRTNENKKKLYKASKKALLSLVAARLKNQVLFPQRVKEMREYLEQAEVKVS
jgi:hypothetical protein